MRRLIATASAFVAAAVIVPAALAATATPFGGATTSGGVLNLVSNTGDAGATNDSSGASFTGTGVTTFSSITTLSTEFNVTDDDCAGGSPRFQVRVQTPSGEKNVFVYLGPTPSFTGCSQNVWIASGNLIGSADGRYDTSQVQAGTQVSTYAQALALVGSFQVTGISLVVDSGWAFADKEQTVNVRNVKVNTSTFFTPEGSHPPGHGQPPAGHEQPPAGHGMNAAHACKKLHDEMGDGAFHMAFGTNHNHANAFGKCVSKMAHMKNDAHRAAAVVQIGHAADHCAARTTSGETKNARHGDDDQGEDDNGHGKGRGHGKGKGAQKKLAQCLRNAT
jgi:hypothetical protein